MLLPVMVMMLVLAADEHIECQTFRKVFGNGKNLCEKMWGDAFVYSTDEEHAYTMFFTDSTNPNDAVSERLAMNQTLYGYLRKGESEKCLSYLHKDAPSPQPEDEVNICYPWRERSCCHSHNVQNVTQLKGTYGSGYHWDRCGKMSAQCEHFFINEACMYECEPAAYHFMRYPDHSDAVGEHPNAHDATNSSHNKWELYHMPIKASYCDAWYHACKNDLFCNKNEGNYFACAIEYRKESELVFRDGDGNLGTGWVTGIISVFAFVIPEPMGFFVIPAFAVIALWYLAKRERASKSTYNPISNVVVPAGVELQEAQSY